jgi:hypothetical protein
MLFEVEAFDHTLPEACEEVNVTEPPAQNVVGPLALITGVVGFAFTVIFVTVEVEEHPFPSVYVTEYGPPAVTLIVCEVAAFDQTFPEACEDVKSTEPPAQNVVGPPADIVGNGGFELTVTAVIAEVAEHPFPSVCVTEKLPVLVILIDCVVDVFDQTFPLA